ncbi:MAG: hypothetical protein B7733_11830 [Myxococcales bacterium FL481]|nr:MAG: hypothetical protein B7733_11830 [Myxococcales bacterium FL481]
MWKAGVTPLKGTPLPVGSLVACNTNEIPEFVLRTPRRERELLRPDHTPHAGCRCDLSVGPEEFEGEVPASGGQVRHLLEANENGGTLNVWSHEDARKPVRFDLKIGHLEDVNEPAGGQSRLANLAHSTGRWTVTLTSTKFRIAFTAFAAEPDLEGADDARVRKRLVQVYGR